MNEEKQQYKRGRLDVINETITICEKKIKFTKEVKALTKEAGLTKGGAIKAYREIITQLRNKEKNTLNYKDEDTSR